MLAPSSPGFTTDLQVQKGETCLEDRSAPYQEVEGDPKTSEQIYDVHLSAPIIVGSGLHAHAEYNVRIKVMCQM